MTTPAELNAMTRRLVVLIRLVAKAQKRGNPRSRRRE